MKLTDLNGRLIDQVTLTGYWRRPGMELEGAQGLLFQCPSCGAGMERGEEGGRRFIRGAHHIMVLFSNPRGVAPAPAGCRPSR